MADYKQMYYKLFNKLSDIIEEIQQVQADAEELFLESDDDEEAVVK